MPEPWGGTRVPFLLLFVKVRAAEPPAGVHDAGVLVDGLSEVCAGDGQRSVQPGQGLPVRAQPAAGGLGRLVAGQCASHSVLITTSSFGNWVRALRISRLKLSMAFVYSTSAAPGRTPGTR